MKSQGSLASVLLVTLFSVVFAQVTSAGSATWNLNPTSGDWSTVANWTPATVPNGPSDVATFGVSNVTTVSLAKQVIEVAEIMFNSDASAFAITDASRGSTQLTISGAGIINNSAVPQNFTFEKGTISFTRSATAGSGTVFHGSGEFHDSSSAGTASFLMEAFGDIFSFGDSSSAASATFTILDGAVDFFQSASADNAVSK